LEDRAVFSIPAQHLTHTASCEDKLGRGAITCVKERRVYPSSTQNFAQQVTETREMTKNMYFRTKLWPFENTEVACIP